MSDSPLKFLGATVVSYSIPVGWNDQQTSISITLVEDVANGDLFLLNRHEIDNIHGEYVGTPVAFVHGNVYFGGLLLGFKELNSLSGSPLYEVTLTSPLEILRGVKVILSNYVGPSNDSTFGGTGGNSYSFQVSNMLNVYGFLEDGGENFGNSLINDTGLLWNSSQGIKYAIETLTNQPRPININKDFGSYIVYRGHKYKIDLSGLPVPPDFYRLGGNVVMSLMDIISQIAQDGGVDYIIRLTLGEGNGPHTISFKCVNHVVQLTVGQLSRYISGQIGYENNSVGMELRNDITQAVIVGGEINYIQPVKNQDGITFIRPFWGFDVDGRPILGSKSDQSIFADDDHSMLLNSTQIIDITSAFGYSASYPCTILEMRCALIDYDSWAAYIFRYKKDFAQTIGLNSTVDPSIDGFEAQFPHDYVADDVETVLSLTNMNDNSHWVTVSQRIYEFVKGQAETYYGKKFLIRLPRPVKIKIVPNSTNVIYSDELADAGYLPEGNNLLDLNYINENFFLDQTGRFYPFLRFQVQSVFGAVAPPPQDGLEFGDDGAGDGLGSTTSYDPQRDGVVSSPKMVMVNRSILDDNNYVFQNNSDPTASYIYTRHEQGESAPVQYGGANGGGNIIFISDNGVVYPYIICSIPNAIFAQAEDPLGSVEDIANMLGLDPDNVRMAVTYRSESFPIRIHPPAFYPNGATIALKSNQYTYGPWGKFVTDGQLEFEYDPSLTPWEYGDYTSMNLAAIAKLGNIATGNQVLEKGEITFPGEPDFDLGDYLVNEGPVITRIDVQHSIDGFKTSYTSETFVPRAGSFTRQNADRLKMYGKNLQQMRRMIRQALLTQRDNSILQAKAYSGFMNGTAYAVRQATPHGGLVAHNVIRSSTQNEEDDKNASLVYSNTYREAIGNVRYGTEDVWSSAAMSWDGLFKPYSLSYEPKGLMTGLTRPQGSGNNSIALTNISSDDYTPLQTQYEITWYTSSSGDKPMNPYKFTELELDNVRLIGMKSPMQLTGWGFDLSGAPVPNQAASGNDPLQEWGDDMAMNGTVDPAIQVSGPLDVRWDKFRGVWGYPTFMFCMASGGQYYILDGQGSVIGKDDKKEILPIRHSLSGIGDPNSSSYADGTKVYMGYFPLDGAWRVITQECPT